MIQHDRVVRSSVLRQDDKEVVYATGIVQRKWVWILLFSPLWGTLFISFGIGPIVTRTSDRIPVLLNTAAFLAAALVFRLSPLFKQSAIDTSILKRSSQERDDGG